MFSIPAGGTRLASCKPWEGYRRHTVVTARSLWCPILLLLLIGDGGWQAAVWAQAAPPPPVSSGTTTQEAPPVLRSDLERIKSGLETPIKVRINDGRIRFYAETVAPEGPTFGELSANFNLRSGPVPGSGMTHGDFLNMVTPQVLHGSAGIKPLETLEWGVVNHLGWWAVRKLYKELSEAKDARRVRAIRAQIDRELAALRGRQIVR